MTTVDLGGFNVYIGILINALFTGIGTGAGIAIGSYLVNSHALRWPKRLKKLLRKRKR